jgi:phage terminase small subunit
MLPFQRKPSARRQRFVAHYLLSNDPGAAAIAAGFSAKRAADQGRYLLKDPWVRAAIRARLDVEAARLQVDAGRIVEELARIAFADVTRFVDYEEGRVAVKPPSLLAPADRAAIRRVVKQGDDVEVQLHDKLKALDALGKYFKLWGPQADRFAPPPVVGEGGKLRDFRTPAQERARAALRAQIERVIAQRGTAKDEEPA